MSYRSPPPAPHPLRALRQQFAQADGLPFADVLPADRLTRALRVEGACWRDGVYTPLITLWAFLSQMVCPDGSCRAAVARVLAWFVSHGQPPCSAKTDPYCKARQRLPEGLLRRLTRETGQALHEQVPAAWLWKGRRVKLVDGSTVSMPDTPANQAASPQPSSQAAGLGFPLARVVVVFCLACGTALDLALGRYQGKETGEPALLRSLHAAFAAGDLLLADRYYCSWCEIALLEQRGVDVVLRLHQRRRLDFRRGRRLGADDHVVTWAKPPRPAWMDLATYQNLPAMLRLREVRVWVGKPGFRTQVLELVTTLVDPDAVGRRELATLYRQRWQAELDLRSLKVTLGMDVLRCLSPEMVRKEIWGHLLAYNLLRTVLAQAAQAHGLEPRALSFKGAVQTIQAFAEALRRATRDDWDGLHQALLEALAAHRVGDRPDRYEPRAVKRRPKPHSYLKQPRAQARAALAQPR